MPEEPRRPKFWVTAFGLILCTVACGVIPLYHQGASRDLKSALNINIDIVYLFIFPFGCAVIGVVSDLNRRLASLEKKNAMMEGDKNAER
jgi:hypothetical protein